jgi:hypothetical protein
MCIDHVVQELTPQGVVVGTPWDTMTHIPPSETTDAWIAQQKQPSAFNNCPTQTTGVCDPYHYNSIEDGGDGLIISFRHTDAVYKIDKAMGTIVWKLGGNARPESLQLVNDPLGGTSGQHDARLQGDGTVTIHDNGTNGSGPSRQPRVVRYLIDTNAHTATLTEQLQDADIASSFCCGSARPLPSGNWVVGWGSTPDITENAPDGSRVFHLHGTTVYRGLPLLPGDFTTEDFRAGMDAQYPP